MTDKKMQKVKIIKKADEFIGNYEVGDVFPVEDTWYGGVHVKDRTGLPLSLSREEYELVEETLEPGGDEVISGERDLHEGDIVRHFKREWVSEETSEYLYKILAFAQHTETGEKLVIYEALYPPYKTCARPYGMFMSEVDRTKYPDVQQKYRFEKVETKRWV